MAGALNGDRQFTLMVCTSARHTAGQNLCTLRNKTAKFCNIFIINHIDFIDAETANFSAAFTTARTPLSVGPVRPIVSIVSHENILLSQHCSGMLKRQIVVGGNLLKIIRLAA